METENNNVTENQNIDKNIGNCEKHEEEIEKMDQEIVQVGAYEQKQNDPIIISDDIIINNVIDVFDNASESNHRKENILETTTTMTTNLLQSSAEIITNESTEIVNANNKEIIDTTTKELQNNPEITILNTQIIDFPDNEKLIEILETPEKEQETVVTITEKPTEKKSFLPEVTIDNFIKNSGLGFLQSQYGSDNDSENLETDDEDCIVSIPLNNKNDKEYRDKIIVNSSDSDDSDVEYISAEQKQKIIDLEELIDEDDDEQPNKYKGPIRVKGELTLDDLPPIQDLKITVPEEECVELGKIHSIVDQLVLVDSIPGTVPLDLDTVLFMDKGKSVLGEIFDVLGQIKTPLYCIRFNSNKQIKEKKIEIGQTVYVAPRTEHTQFIILDNLIKIRGSDASWENDVEPNDKHRDFSDDEEEQYYRKNLRNKERSNDIDDPIKRQRIPSTSSSMCGNDDGINGMETNQTRFPNSHNSRNQFNYSGNQRFPRNRRPQQQLNNGIPQQQHQHQPYGGYQPRQQFHRGGRSNPRHRNPSFNYDNFNGGSSWHSNYNNYQQQFQYQQSNPPPQSNLYPNPYATRAPFISPNVMQQPLFPPPPPPPPQQTTNFPGQNN